jgi:hypothetical protein
LIRDEPADGVTRRVDQMDYPACAAAWRRDGEPAIREQVKSHDGKPCLERDRALQPAVTGKETQPGQLCVDDEQAAVRAERGIPWRNELSRALSLATDDLAKASVGLEQLHVTLRDVAQRQDPVAPACESRHPHNRSIGPLLQDNAVHEDEAGIEGLDPADLDETSGWLGTGRRPATTRKHCSGDQEDHGVGPHDVPPIRRLARLVAECSGGFQPRIKRSPSSFPARLGNLFPPGRISPGRRIS